MSCLHYKFSSSLKYHTLIFNGLHISLRDLKRQIMAREKLKAPNSDLQITNAQTKEEYTDDDTLIPKNCSVIVRRIPAGGVKAPSKTSVPSPAEPVSGTPKAVHGSSASISVSQLTQTANLAEASATEEEKIKAMMTQSCREYDPVNYVKNPLAAPPPSYTCFRCGKPGHYIRNCPAHGDKKLGSVPRLRKSTGIPRSFMMEVKDPSTKGAMITTDGKYVIPFIIAEAYARGKKEKPPFLSEQPPSSSSDPVPEELLCPMCKEIMTDAAVIPCCGNSYCDECIRTALLESEEHTCPTCHQTDVSPDALVANRFLRQAVNSFSNGTGYTKRRSAQIREPQQQPPPLPPPPPPLLAVTPPAALGCQAPALRQPALPSLLGPPGQPIPTAGHPMRATAVHCSGARPGWERYSNSRSSSSRTNSSSRSLSHSRSRSYLRSPPHPRRGKGKSRNSRARSRSRGSRHSRSRSPPYRRYRSRSRSPGFRGRTPTERTVPEGGRERGNVNRYRGVPPYHRKAYERRSSHRETV